jgi:hypothetical protein
MLLQVARRSAAQTLHLDFNKAFQCSELSQNQRNLSEITQVSKLVAKLGVRIQFKNLRRFANRIESLFVRVDEIFRNGDSQSRRLPLGQCDEFGVTHYWSRMNRLL